MESIIGRKKEQKELEQVYNSNKAEFVVVYG
jgi:AAA+ ATPase superfamily predicted ATPase